MVALSAGLVLGGQPPASPAGGRPAVRLVEIAHLDKPLAMALRPGDDSFYIGEKGGRVRRVGRDGHVFANPVVDLSKEVSSGAEQGLVGVTFNPDGDRLYIGITDRQGDSRILEFAFDGTRAVASSRRQVLFLDQPHEFHNNGQVIFGPDGMLYLGFGDGGQVREYEHRAQDLGTLFGKVLRIDPRPTPTAPYRIPDDNPYSGRDGARPEVWQYGLRQPWRFTFDRLTHDFWVGDVGEAVTEEVDFLPAGVSGANFGWDSFEGSRPHLRNSPPEDHVLPVTEYEHGPDRCAVIGGYVYRGRLIPELQGAFVFGDLCGGNLTGLRQVNGKAQGIFDLGVEVERPTSFGEDADGELYVMSQAGGLFRLEGSSPTE